MSFTLQQEKFIPEISATAKLYTHDKTGARLLSLLNDDENKAFGITFRTPPQTSNGIAHIMEHSVLCGSRKYPVKEPFIELAKGSLNTFLNAMTFPDKTCYPIASQNLQDFYNLIDVYLDAVFYPLLPETTLMQEGWHYELETPNSTESPLTFKGVVFNEMKGNYSSPDSLLYEYSQRAIFPESPYGLDSGGDPAVIPDLTYAEFKAFHANFYHPSNAYIWFSGDDPEDKRLTFLDEWLEAFERSDPTSQIALQPHFESPRRAVHVYDSGDSDDAKSYVTVNWLMPQAGHPDSLGLAILSHVLTATPASPLRKALMDSGLGEDLIGVGFEESLAQMYYGTGMKGIAAENVDAVEALILKTLTDLAQDGIDPGTIAASLNTIEFRLREQNTGRFPRGLVLMINALSTWLYDGDPLQGIAFEAKLDAVKTKLASGGRYFEDLIQSHWLDNPHRATVILNPDPEEGARREAAEAARLAQVKAAMTPADLGAVIETAAELKRHQDAPDSPAALATIPALSLDDLDKENKPIPFEITTAGETPVYVHDIFTNGIVYLDLGFDLHNLPADLLPYMGLFGRALLQMGTATQDFVQLTQRIGRETGGIGSGVLTSMVRESQDAALWFFLRGKAVTSQAGELLAILQDVLLTANLDNRERFKQIVLENKARTEAGLIPGGHSVVNGRLRARYNEADWVAEQIGGLEQLFFLRKLAEQVDADWPGVLANLEAVRTNLLNRTAAIVNLTLDADNWAVFQPQLTDFLDTLPARPVSASHFQPVASTVNEGLTIPSQVNYVGKAANLYGLGYEPHGSISVINNYLGTTWLWEKVRVQGGAYGGFATFDTHSGVWAYLSYRDPNLLATLENYDQTAQFLANLDLSAEELTKSIIGTIGSMDAYQLPDAKGYTSLMRHLTGYSDVERQRVREQVLGTSVQDFKSFASVLELVAEKGDVVVLGSADAIAKANQERGGFLHVKKVL